MNLVSLLESRAQFDADKTAFTFIKDNGEVADCLTYKELYHDASIIAKAIQACTAIGDRVILSYPAGLDFIRAFFGSLIAGTIAVPVFNPSKRKQHWLRLASIVDDCAPALFMGEKDLQQHAQSILPGHSVFLSTEQALSRNELAEKSTQKQNIAYLQYTSGSTGDPKGVCITHGNALHNVNLIADAFQQDEDAVVVGWLPHYHDQGLVGNILLPIFLNVPAVLMSPVAFLQQPFRWLKTLSDYSGTISGGPNFCYDLCVEKVTAEQKQQLDLSRWNVAYNGAEPVQQESLLAFSRYFSDCGFQHVAHVPAYGLAESTLGITGTPRNIEPQACRVNAQALRQHRWLEDVNGQPIVSSGIVWGGMQVEIVDTVKQSRCKPGMVGEIWVSGASVAPAYWNKPALTRETMQVQLAEVPGEWFLRTGDLGFMKQGHLFVTGRLKDLIIIRGKNYYPHDIEKSIQSNFELFKAGTTAAFAVHVDGVDKLVIVQEVPRVAIKNFDTESYSNKITQVVNQAHELSIDAVVFIRQATLPKTSSGKIQRKKCAQLYSEQKFNDIKVSNKSSNKVSATTDSTVERSVVDLLAKVVEVPTSGVSTEDSLYGLGIDSLKMVRIHQAIAERFDVAISLDSLFDIENIAELSQLITASKSATEGLPQQSLVVKKKQANQDEFPLSSYQLSLHAAARLAANPAVFNLTVPVSFKLASSLDLNQIYRKLVDAHPMLGCQLVVDDDHSVLRIAEGMPGIFINGGEPKPSDDWMEQVTNLSHLPFDFQHERLFQIHVFPCTDGLTLVVFRVHHLIVDLWSLLIVLQDFIKLVNGESLPVLVYDYQSFSLWHQDLQKTDFYKEQQLFWQEELNNLPTLELPYLKQRPFTRDHHAHSIALPINNELSYEVNAFIERHRCTAFHFFTLCYFLLLSKISKQQDIVVGSPYFGRTEKAFHDVAGYFVNMLPHRQNVDSGQTVLQFLQQIKLKSQQLLKYQYLPFAELVQLLQSERVPGVHPGYQASFAFQQTHTLSGASALILNQSKCNLTLNGIEAFSYPVPDKLCQVDIALTMVCSGQSYEARLDCAKDILSTSTMQSLADGFIQLIQQVLYDPQSSIEQLSLSDRRYQDWVFNKAPAITVNQTTTELFSQACQAFPSNNAIDNCEEILTYNALQSKVHKVAYQLTVLSVGQGDCVAIVSDASIESLTLLFAAMQLGIVVTFIDPDLGVNRRDTIIEQFDADWIFYQGEQRSITTENKSELTDFINKSSFAKSAYSAIDAKLDQIAYIIFTSGSTGAPKGLRVTHRSLANRIQWMKNNLALNESDTVIQKAPLSFDVSLWEIFWPLVSGAKLLLATRETSREPEALLELIQTQRVTQAQFVPSYLDVLLQTDNAHYLSTLRRVIVGGEILCTDLAKQLLAPYPSIELHNFYGPSETGFVTHQFVNEFHRKINTNLGHGIDGVHVFVLDDMGRPCLPGMVGEINIGGEALGAGYLDQELNQLSYQSVMYRGKTERFYKSGDYALYHENGEIEFIGRKDGLVKIRGNRIELGEVNAQLLICPGVKQAHAFIRENAKGEPILIAAVTPEAVDNRVMFNFLQRHLPDYMIPLTIYAMPEFPLTAHGKIDTKLLSKKAYEGASTPALKPTTMIEQQLAAIWQDLLQLEVCSLTDNFFRLGGHSLTAARLVAAVEQEFNIRIPAQMIFVYPSLGCFANELQQLVDSKTPTECSEFEELSL